MADLKKKDIPILLIAIYFCIVLTGQVWAADATMPDAAAGIIEIESGFLDEKGAFRKMKSGSGFLIANQQNGTYIITNCSNVSNTPSAIKKYCKKHSIETGSTQYTNYIQVVVKGDVKAQAEVVVKSAEKDYCVLSAANVVSQRESLRLGDSSDVEVNDLVYAYGFPEETGIESQSVEYSAADVRPIQGAVTEKEAYLEGGVYLAHSAPIGEGYAGGPLLDTDGYVIGLICKKSLEDDTGIAYALPINEISALLDNFSIYYGSQALDEAYMKLESLYQECAQISESGGYKKASMEVLSQTLEVAEKTKNTENPHVTDLLDACHALMAAKEGLVPKTKVLTIIIRVLPFLDLILFFWMLILVVKNSGEKKQMNAPQLQNTASSGEEQNAMYHRQVGYYGQAGAQNAGYRGRTGIQRADYPGQSGMQNVGYPRQQAGLPAGKRLQMIRQKTGQVISVNKNQFVVGKSQEMTDFCIADNRTISRKHAVLFEDNGCWYLDDLNSLNGTYINGTKIMPGQALRVNDGDEIVLSGEAFLVRL